MSDLARVLKKASPSARPKIIAAHKRAEKARLEATEVRDLRSQIVTCRACPLNRTRNKAVPFSGPTHGRADLMIFGEAPGANEDRQGVPFVGRSGQMLDWALTMAGTSRERCFVANTLCCRPPGNRDPEPAETEACRTNFTDQMELAGMWVGVTLGGYALASVLGVGRNEVKVKNYLEKPLWHDGRIWVATYHPAFVAREKERFTDVLVNSLVMALAIRKGDTLFPRPSKWVDVVKLGDKDAGTLEKKMKKDGWALVESSVLRSQIVVVDEYARARIPFQLKDVPKYTVEELTRIGVAGAERNQGWTADELRRLHYVKVEMGGEVIYG